MIKPPLTCRHGEGQFLPVRKRHQQEEAILWFEILKRLYKHSLPNTHHRIESTFPAQHFRSCSGTGLLEPENGYHLTRDVHRAYFVPWAVRKVEVPRDGLSLLRHDHRRHDDEQGGPGR